MPPPEREDFITEIRRLTQRIERIEQTLQAQWFEISAFAGAWTNYDASLYETAAVRFVSTGVVAFKGLVAGGDLASIIFTIPSEYCPLKIKRISCVLFDTSAFHPGSLAVTPSGDVQVDGTGPTNPIEWVSIEAMFAL